MIFNPPLKIGVAEVTSIDPYLKEVRLVLHVKGTKEEYLTGKGQILIADQIRAVYKYLIAEDFIRDVNHEWSARFSTIVDTK